MTDTARYYANVYEDGEFPVHLEADPNLDYRDDSCIELNESFVARYEEVAREYRALNRILLVQMGNDYMAREWEPKGVVFRG